nr:hypothetical protein [Aureimonas ureilytica]
MALSTACRASARPSPSPLRRLSATARQAVDRAKRALGERGPVWWSDGAPDLNRRLVRNTPYADWYAGLESEQDGARDRTEPGDTPEV